MGWLSSRGDSSDEVESLDELMNIVITDMCSGNKKMNKTGRKLFFAPDPEHLVKAIRNYFIANELLMAMFL